MRLLPLALLFVLFHGTCVRAQTVYRHDRSLPGGALVVDEDLRPFYHGVASGDPLDDRVVIWTRVTPETLNAAPVKVTWTLATDPELEHTVREGTYTTDADRDYTVKVDVDGLAPGTTYYYGFTAGDRHSLTGRTKTTPTGAAADHLRFAVVSCSNYQAGYFNAYGRLADRNDLDAVIHLGDYIYEYANRVYGSPGVWDDRPVAPDREIVSLEDYRTRYSTYRLDEDLRRMHQQHAMVAVWDDHESANDSYVDGANNHQEDGEGSWQERKESARRAYFEWLPIRDTGDRSVYRTLSYGDLADLIMLDTRLEGREKQLADVTDPTLEDPDRTILGAEQRAWLLEQLAASTARYRLIGNQVLFSELNVGWAGRLVGQPYERVESGYLDIWDGYPAERRRVVEALREVDDVVILTGDFHSSFAFEVAVPANELSFREEGDLGRVPVYTASAYDPATAAGAVAVEFATPSISAANFDENTGAAIAALLQRQINTDLEPNDTLNLGNPNPHMKYADLTRHGYYLLDVRPEGVQADYFYGPILERATTETFGAGFTKAAGSNRLVAVTAPAAGKARPDAPAPDRPPGLSTAVRADPATAPRVLSLAPNPVGDMLRVAYALPRPATVTAELLDAAGRRLRELHRGRQPAGTYTLTADLAGLPGGSYYLRLTTADGTCVQPLVKR